MHTRHCRASVDLSEAPPARRPATRHSATSSNTPLTLWADRPLAVRQGRLIGVRLHGSEVQVRLVDSRDGLGRWCPAQGLISEFQAAQWVANSQFHA